MRFSGLVNGRNSLLADEGKGITLGDGLKNGSVIEPGHE
jgi:hypothetical protein